MRREYDGYNDEALEDPTVDCRELITGADFNGEGATFWLRYLIIRNSGVAGVCEIYDQDEGVAVAANKRFELDVPAGTTTYVDIPAPGISFKTNLTAGLTGAAGTVDINCAHAGGYLVGGME